MGSDAKVARVRIGRVKLKAGGTLRVIEPPQVNDVVKLAMNWCRQMPEWEVQPSAVVMVTWWPAVKGETWNPPHTIDWITRDPDLPMNRLFQVSAAKIRDRGATLEGQYRTLHDLGVVDPEDDAS